MMRDGRIRLAWASLALLVVAFMGCGRERMDNRPATIVITSAPVPDAQVTVEGVPYGPAPVVVDGVKPGMAVVVLEKDGFKRTARTVTVVPGQRQQKTIELDRKAGLVTFNSTPPKAQVYLDGEEHLGETPLNEIRVAAGKHKYQMRMENYEIIEADITVEEDYRYSYTHEMVPLPAVVSVISVPTGAEIALNDEPQARKTPSQFSLMPGDYTFSLQANGFIPAEQTIKLGPNEKRVLEMAMTPGDAPPGMMLVPGGKFIMGQDKASPDERPRREIELKPFYIDKYEVTNQQYKEVFPTHSYPDFQAMFPVTGISFEEANAYAQKVGKRLPTEAEWEKAARGKDAREYPWGNMYDPERCNTNTSGKESVVRVGQYRLGASPYGCMDMAGNAYEWTSDWYQPYPGNPDVTKDYGQVFRVLRGGSFKSSPFEARCMRRHYDRMDVGRDDYGIRCVKDVP